MNVNNDYIQEKVFKKEFGDLEIITEEFHEYISVESVPKKILYCLYNNELNSNDLAIEMPEDKLKTIKTALTRLAKSLQIKITKTDNKTRTYTIHKKGLIELNLVAHDYIRQSEYIQDNKQIAPITNNKLIKKIANFINDELMSEVHKLQSGVKEYLEISVAEAAHYEPEIADTILDKPELALTIIKSFINDEFFKDEGKDYREIMVRFKDIPKSNQIYIGDRRSKHLGSLVQVVGMIKRKTTINPQVIFKDYVCSNEACSLSVDGIRVPQSAESTKEIKKCTKCKCDMELIKEVKVDGQYILLEEDISMKEHTDSSVAKIKCLLQNDLTSPINDLKNNTSSKVIINGILKDEAKPKTNGTEKTFYIEVNNLINDTELNEIKLNKEDIEEIKAFGSNPNCYEELKKNYIPSIKGYQELKECLLLQQFGGCEFSKKRKDTHILMIGDPGMAKSEIAKCHSSYSPKSMYSSGQSSSKAGLTASVVKDEMTGEYVLEAGALPMAHKGGMVIDEMDKMNKDDTSAMHEALESQTITTHKANIHNTLHCQCWVTGAANPKHSKFDDGLTIDQQIEFPASLLSRFDLIFILKDQPNKKQDLAIANHIMSEYEEEEERTCEIEPTFYKKYIHYVKNNKKLTMNKEVKDYLTNEYVKRRNVYDPQGTKFSLNSRQLIAWTRFTFAIAKATFSDELKLEHAKRSIELFDYCNEKLGFENINAIEAAREDLSFIDNSLKVEILKLLNKQKEIKYSELKLMFGKQLDTLKAVLKELKKEESIIEVSKGLYQLGGAKK